MSALSFSFIIWADTDEREIGWPLTSWTVGSDLQVHQERESAIIRWLQSTIANAFSYTLDGRAKKSVHEPRVDHSVSISVWPLSWGSVLRTLMATLIMLTPSTLGKETITSWSQETASAHPKRLWKKNSCRGLCLSSSRVNVSFFLLSLSASSAITSWSSSRERKGIILDSKISLSTIWSLINGSWEKSFHSRIEFLSTHSSYFCS